MSAGRSIVAAGIVGAVLWAVKRQGQGVSVDTTSLKTAVDDASTGGRVDVGRLLDNLSGLFDGMNRKPSKISTPDLFSGLHSRLDPIKASYKPTGATPRPRGGSEPRNIGTQLMIDLMRDFGLAKHQAAGVVGNLDHESAGFKSLQEIKPLVPGSRGGWGYAQWTGPRRRDFEAWVKARGLDGRSYAANYGFLKHELTNTEERRVLRRLKATKTVDEAARVFSGSSQKGASFDGFLRPGIPHMSSRIQRARRYA